MKKIIAWALNTQESGVGEAIKRLSLCSHSVLQDWSSGKCQFRLEVANGLLEVKTLPTLAINWWLSQWNRARVSARTIRNKRGQIWFFPPPCLNVCASSDYLTWLHITVFISAEITCNWVSEFALIGNWSSWSDARRNRVEHSCSWDCMNAVHWKMCLKAWGESICSISFLFTCKLCCSRGKVLCALN